MDFESSDRSGDGDSSSKSGMKLTRIFVGGLGDHLCRDDLEREFSKYGKLNGVWVAQNPPGFAFIEYDDDRDADEAVKAMNGAVLNGARIRVELSRDRGRGGRGRGGRGGGRGRSFSDSRGGRGGGFFRGGRGGSGFRGGSGGFRGRSSYSPRRGSFDSYRNSGDRSSGGWSRRGGSGGDRGDRYDSYSMGSRDSSGMDYDRSSGGDSLYGSYDYKSGGGSSYRSRSPVGHHSSKSLSSNSTYGRRSPSPSRPRY